MRLRFSLRGLILRVTAVGLYLGAREWRRQSVRKLCADLEQHYVVDVPNSWQDRIFQRKPTVGTIFYRDGKPWLKKIVFRSGATLYGAFDPEEIERLKALGVVDYAENGPRPRVMTAE
jgi:hypothetical protein